MKYNFAWCRRLRRVEAGQKGHFRQFLLLAEALPFLYVFAMIESCGILPPFDENPTERYLIMAKIRCDKVTEGLRKSEVLASFHDYRGRTHFIRVEQDFLSKEQDVHYLPVGIVHVDPKSKAILVELPHEAETGANRLWVKQEQLDEPIEAFA